MDPRNVITQVEALEAQNHLRGDLLEEVLGQLLEGTLDPGGGEQVLVVLLASLNARIVEALGGSGLALTDPLT